MDSSVDEVKSSVFTWIKNKSLSWLRSNWLIILIFSIVIGFALMQTYSMASSMSTLNNVLNDKTDEIVQLQMTVSELEGNLEKLNSSLAEAQAEIKHNTALFWSKFNQIKIDSQNQTPEEVLQDWQNTWPGGK